MTDAHENPPRKGRGGRKTAEGEAKEKRPLNAASITKRGTELAAMEDKKKAAQGRRRLLMNLLKGISDGSIGQPSKAAEAYLAVLPVKEAAK